MSEPCLTSAPRTSPEDPEYQYSWEEWQEHCDHFMKVGTREPELNRYILDHYSHSLHEGIWKITRFRLAINYLLTHLEDFEEFVVMSGNRGLLSQTIVRTLWGCFGLMPDKYLGQPDPKDVLEIARETKELGW